MPSTWLGAGIVGWLVYLAQTDVEGDSEMTDRELLELAAKAAEVELRPMEVKNVTQHGDDRFIGYMTNPEQWQRGWFNPLTDDGDALRLAVKLGIDLEWRNDGRVAAYRHANANGYCFTAFESSREERDAATRRAIVRAAAEIGRG